MMDLPRSGRPVTYDAKARARVIVVVCETLDEHELPLSRFSITDLLKVVVREEVCWPKIHIRSRIRRSG